MMGCRVEKATFWRDLWEVGLSMPSAVDERHGLNRREIYDREQECFRLLFKRLPLRLRRLGDDRPFYFFRSREAQPKRGSIAPHLLCMGNPFKGLRRRERVRILEACGFGYKHSSAPARSLQGLAVYYTDYITKQAQERDPRYRIPANVCRYTYSPGFMPDRESFRIYSRLCYQCPEEGVEVVCVYGPAGPVRLDQSTRWWLTPEWRAAKKARWWEHGDGLLAPERVEEEWSYVGRFGPSGELRFAACHPRRRGAAAPAEGDRLLQSGPAIPTS